MATRSTAAARPQGAVLVTGGAGYVGCFVARRLAEAGRRVVVLDDLSTGHADVVRWSPLVVGDVGDASIVRAAIRDHGVTAAVHLAAKALVPESIARPGLYDAWNRGKTETFVRVAAAEGLGAVVFSSTCAVYGEPMEVPIPETHPRQPVNPYGASKAAAEDALLAAGLPVALLRYFNAAGADPGAGLGERHVPETHLIPIAVRAALGDGTLVVHGADYDTPDGTCLRDYVHVLDLADAHFTALERLEAGRPGGAWNLGSGRGTSVREVVAAVGRVTGAPVPAEDGPRRPGDSLRLVAAVDRARADLGWNPSRSGLDRIVADAVAFHREWATAEGREPQVVAIDGPAGAGKSTVARRLAQALGWAYLDTGAMYRALALAVLRARVSLEDADAVRRLASRIGLHLRPDGSVRVEGEDVTRLLRTPEVTVAASHVAGHAAVREVMVEHQRRYVRQNRRVVAEGRDIGTVVFPAARVKIYLDADPAVRAGRRHRELGAGELEGVRRGLDERDQRDSTRAVAPLRPAEDAWVLDTSPLSPDEVFERVLAHVTSRVRPAPSGPSAGPGS